VKENTEGKLGARLGSLGIRRKNCKTSAAGFTVNQKQTSYKFEQ
jgi:hypothetical protein